MFVIDERFKGSQVRQFASELDVVDENVKKFFEQNFNGDESADFYAGLLAGLGGAHQLVENNAGQFLGPILAFVADQIEKKELISE